MKEESHKRLTEFVFDMLSASVNYFPLSTSKIPVAQQAYDTDHAKDLEFVDVEGGIGSGGRDDPHKEEWAAINDVPRYVDGRLAFVIGSHCLTAFNHFIDIRKGKANARFDDFDGYSYHHGSASKLQFEEHADLLKIDEAINYWFNDEYVHVPGDKWYRDCSPSVPRYSFYADKNVYGSSVEEGLSRFPLAESLGKADKGIPYSVFMPVDNMARFWYWNYKNNQDHDPKDLGYVMHAIQDASIPHHAAGCCGNWHAKYEETVRNRLDGWLGDTAFQADIKTLFKDWSKIAPTPPKALDIGDEFVVSPRRNWRIEWLVTWMALNAYRAYIQVHHNFANGWKDDEPSMKELTKKATALSMLALYEASLLERIRDFNPNMLHMRSQLGKWCIGVSCPPMGIANPLEQFDTQAEAAFSLQIIQHYGMDSRCTAGKMSYYLANGKAPFNNKALNGQKMAPFDPDSLQVKSRPAGGRISWMIAEGDKKILDFQTSQGDAMRAYHVIQKYGFDHYCWLGNRSSPTMQYFLRDRFAVPVNVQIP